MGSNKIDFECKTPVFYFTQEDVKQILKLHNKTVEDVPRDIQIIRDWFNAQPHLPKPCPDSRVILNILIGSKFSIENTKRKVDSLYTIRSVLPELFVNRLPDGDDVNYLRRFVKDAVIPKLVNYNRVGILFLDEWQLKYDMDTGLATHLMYFELINLFDIHNRLDVIMDGRNFTMDNVLPFTPTILKKVVKIGEKLVGNRINAIHFINFPSFVHTLVTLFKSLLREKIRNRIHMHKNYEGLHDFYPKECLPEEFGGTGSKLRSLSDQLHQLALDNLEHFKTVQNLRVDDNLRPEKLDNDEFLGYHGNFKKLQVD